MARVLRGFRSFTWTPSRSSAIGMSHNCLCLNSQPQLVLIYQPRRDGRLSRPWCEVAQAEIRTRNLPIGNLALYHTATSHSRSSERTRVDPPPMTSYWRSVTIWAYSRTVYEINGDFSRKSQIFPTPCIFYPSLRVPLRIGYWRLGSEKLEWWRYRAEKNMFDDIFSHLDIIRERGGRTDRHRPTAKTALMHSVAR